MMAIRLPRPKSVGRRGWASQACQALIRSLLSSSALVARFCSTGQPLFQELLDSVQCISLSAQMLACPAASFALWRRT